MRLRAFGARRGSPRNGSGKDAAYQAPPGEGPQCPRPCAGRASGPPCSLCWAAAPSRTGTSMSAGATPCQLPPRAQARGEATLHHPGTGASKVSSALAPPCAPLCGPVRGAARCLAQAGRLLGCHAYFRKINSTPYGAGTRPLSVFCMLAQRATAQPACSSGRGSRRAGPPGAPRVGGIQALPAGPLFCYPSINLHQGVPLGSRAGRIPPAGALG